MSSIDGDTPSTFFRELAALRARVDRLEHERDIVRVLSSYGPALDDGDDEGWASCFTDDGVWETTGPGVRRTHRLEGRAALLEFASQHTRSPDHLHKHCVFGSRVDVDDNTANAVSYFARLDGLPEGPVLFAFGRYHDRLERRDGCWRIVHRRCEIDATGPRKA